MTGRQLKSMAARGKQSKSRSPVAPLSQLRWVAIFTLLLLAVSAVPVLAEEAPPPPAPTEAELARLPDPQEIQEGIETATSQEAAREAELEGPAAAEEREESRDAFADATSSEAKDLLSALFAEQLAALNSDPARFLSEAQLLDVVDDGTVATVKEEGDSSLLDAGIPVQAENEEGDLRKVDLSLLAGPEGYEPVNPLTEVSIPPLADGEIEVGEQGVSVSQTGAGPSSAQPFGEENVFYPDVLPDTDLLVSPISTGVELFNQLRSELSPETLTFALDVPAGAELRASDDGGAEVAEGTRLLTRIPPPSAVDAQSSDVAVQMSVEGDSLVLSVPHREADLAYPILVDPVYEDHQNWVYGQHHWALNDGSWSFNNGGSWWISGSTYCIAGCFGLPQGTRGLYVSARSGNYGANQFGSWSFSAPNAHSHISRVTLMPYWRDVYGCNQDQPHDYFGVWSADTNGWAYLSVGSANYGGGSYTIPYEGDAAIFGLGTAGSSVDLECTRDLYAGGAHMWLDDHNWPSIQSVSGDPTGWFSDTMNFTMSAQLSDIGLGIRNAKIDPDGTALIYDIPPQNQCAGTRNNPCLTGHTASWTLNGNLFDEGRTANVILAEDPTGKVSTGYHFETKVDRTPPEVTLSGQLAQETNETGSQEQGTQAEALVLPVYNLKIAATDGSLAPERSRRSGVKDIKVFLDGKSMPVTWSPQSCPNSSCPMTVNYKLRLHEVSTAGIHKLKVIAVDHVGKERKREIEFEYFPATGMKDEYVMHHFALPDGQGDEAEEVHPDRPELAVNVMNGNLVYREEDVEVDGPAVDLEVERYYNSMLPDSENTEWGDGWTLAQTPQLEPLPDDPDPGVPTHATLLEESGAMQDDVTLPTTTGAQSFNPSLQATVTKKASGGYELTDETGESATSVAFDATGQTEALLTEGFAKVDYDYEGGHLAEIAVQDPGSAGGGPAEGSGDPPSANSPYTGVLYADAFGSEGSGAGQLKTPADVAVDSAGNLWVIDRGNDRVQKFSPTGELLDSFGSSGTGDGQFTWPSGIAIDPEGNVLVTDSANHRVQKFNAQGEYLSKFGSFGTGNGQFNGPAGIAIAPGGAIFVTDRGNHRVQRFTKAGAYYGQVGSYGWEDAKFDEPLALAIGGPHGEYAFTVFVVDGGNNRLQRFTPFGSFIAKFGTYGTGDGQLDSPANVEIDAKGNVWVGDRRNARVQLFDQAGKYIDQFGTKGTEEGQFDLAYPMGIASDGAGGIWVTDGNHHRLQKWVAGSYEPDPEEQLPEDDPAVDVDLEGGLVTGLDGEEAGEHTYSRSGALLTAHDGPQGETKYEYDTGKRLSKVTLPNGTWGSIVYFADGRVKSVTVDPAGAVPAKTTNFEYSDEPRRTTVIPPDAPHVTYDIGEDGSVLKWWNTLQPPTFDVLSGSLYEHKEKLAPVGDHNLVIQVHSEEGIASIEVIANGDQLVDERHCSQDPEKAGLECLTEVNEWVTETGAHTPGILNLEVIATDRLGNAESRRFWVDIPYTPPPPPGSPAPPKFKDILSFRENFGLEVIFPVKDELELNDRIFELIGAWHDPSSPAGQVARTSWERWGVPLRPVDIAELEYRERYLSANGPAIAQWGEKQSPSTYAGYSIDHRAGGKIRVGFTANQASSLANLVQAISPLAADRFTSFISQPQHPLVGLEKTGAAVAIAAQSRPDLFTRGGLNIEQNLVRVGTRDKGIADSFLAAHFGANAPVAAYQDPSPPVALGSRFRSTGRLRAGDVIYHMRDEGSECTAGFGAMDTPNIKPNGELVKREYLLTAAHCEGLKWYRNVKLLPNGELYDIPIGKVERSGFWLEGHEGFTTDALAIRLNAPGLTPHWIQLEEGSTQRFRHPVPPTEGMVLCFSGISSQRVRCGPVNGPPEWVAYEGKNMYQVPLGEGAIPGDSGGPVWQMTTGNAVGLISSGPEGSTTQSYITPLEAVAVPEAPEGRLPGILRAPGTFPLTLVAMSD